MVGAGGCEVLAVCVHYGASVTVFSMVIDEGTKLPAAAVPQEQNNGLIS
jgi:hypothetical protein